MRADTFYIKESIDEIKLQNRYKDKSGKLFIDKEWIKTED